MINIKFQRKYLQNIYLHFVKNIRYISVKNEVINALPDNSSVNTVQHATIEEAVFFVDRIDAPIDWLDTDHMIYVFTLCPCPFRGYIMRAGSCKFRANWN
jgi:hypothetical protein